MKKVEPDQVDDPSLMLAKQAPSMPGQSPGQAVRGLASAIGEGVWTLAATVLRQRSWAACVPEKFWAQQFTSVAGMCGSDDDSTDEFLTELLTCHRPASCLHHKPSTACL